MANAGLVKELEARGTGAPLSTGELDKIKAEMRGGNVWPTHGASVKPELLKRPRGGKADDLSLISGIADNLVEKLNAIGIWHFDQIAKWTPAEFPWFESQLARLQGSRQA